MRVEWMNAKSTINPILSWKKKQAKSLDESKDPTKHGYLDVFGCIWMYLDVFGVSFLFSGAARCCHESYFKKDAASSRSDSWQPMLTQASRSFSEPSKDWRHSWTGLLTQVVTKGTKRPWHPKGTMFQHVSTCFNSLFVDLQLTYTIYIPSRLLSIGCSNLPCSGFYVPELSL